MLGFLGSLITNLKLDFENSKWRMPGGGPLFLKKLCENWLMVFGVTEVITNLKLDFQNGRFSGKRVPHVS